MQLIANNQPCDINVVPSNQIEPFFIKDFTEYGQLYRIHFSPYEWTKDIILLAFEQRIILAEVSFKEKFDVKTLYEFKQPSRCTALSISPNTSFMVLPNEIVFASGSADYKIRVFETDLQQNNYCRVLNKHTSYINDISYDSENLYMASASDDNTVNIWCTNGYELKTTFRLESPAVTVCWHRGDSVKLLIAEKIGLMKFYDLKTETLMLSLDFGKPLSSAHWAPSDSQLLASLHLGDLLLWDLEKSTLPRNNTILFSENCGSIKFSPQGELLAGVNCLEGTLKIVHSQTDLIKLSIGVSLPTNIEWHYLYPVVCIGDDSKLCFWKVSSN